MVSGDDPRDPPEQPDSPKLIRLEHKAAADDVFRYVLNRADVLRQRAQLAATIAGVAAVAILTSTLSNLGSYGHLVTYTLVAGAIVWTVSLVMWVSAIGGQITAIDPQLSAEDTAWISRRRSSRPRRTRRMFEAGSGTRCGRRSPPSA